MRIILFIALILVAVILLPSAVLAAIAHLRMAQPGRRHGRERRFRRTLEQHIKAVEISMEVTKDPATRKALQARKDHLQERVRKFVQRKKTDRRHSHGAA